MSAGEASGGKTRGGEMRGEAAPPVVDQGVLDDLKARLRAFRRIALPGGWGWRRGVDPDSLTELVAYWAESYDWRVHEDRIRRLPWVRTPARAIHQRSARAGADAVLLLHGWPDSVLRFERVLPLLTDHHVVAPCLPGFPFAAPGPGMSADEMAGVVAETMDALGTTGSWSRPVTWVATWPRRWRPGTRNGSPRCT